MSEDFVAAEESDKTISIDQAIRIYLNAVTKGPTPPVPTIVEPPIKYVRTYLYALTAR